MTALIGVLAGVGTAFSWSVSSTVHAQASRLLGVHPFMMLRQPLAVCVLCVVCALAGELRLYPWGSASMALLSGFVGIAMCDWCTYESIGRIGIRSTLVCLSLNSCVTALLGAAFLGESLGGQGLAGMGIATAGVVMVIVGEQRDVHSRSVSAHERNVGLMLACGAACAMAVGMIASKEALRLDMPPLALSLLRNVAATVILWAFGVGLHRARRALHALHETPVVIKYLLAGCFFGPTGGIWLSCVALQHLPAAVAATLIGLQPVAVLVVSGLWERHRPAVASIVGACTACAGAAVLLLR